MDMHFAVPMFRRSGLFWTSLYLPEDLKLNNNEVGADKWLADSELHAMGLMTGN